MATRVTSFEIAASDAEATRAPATPSENVVEIGHGGGRFSLWRRPSPGAFSMLQIRFSRKGWEESAKGLDRFYNGIILTPEEAVADGREDGDGTKYEDRVKAGEEVVGLDWFMDRIDAGQMSEDTLFELMTTAIEEHAGFPTSPPDGSSSSPTSTGPRSTAASRRQGSTPSS